MNIEQNNNQEQIKTNEAAKEIAPVEVINVEDKQAKIEEKKQKEEKNNKQINEIKGKIMEQFSDPFSKWKEREIQKINDKAKEIIGESTNAIGGVKQNFDKGFALSALDDYGELKFIDYASKEGNQDDIDYALKLVNSYYRDRDDLKTSLMQRSGQNK